MTPRRALGRALLFWVGYFAILVPTGMLRGMLPPAASPLAWGVLSSAGLMALTLVMLRQEGRTTADIGMRWTGASPRRFGAGLAIGLAVHASQLLTISLATGPLRFTPAPAQAVSAILLVVATTLALGLMEEIGFRGYPLRTLASAIGPVRAQLLVAAVFALTHVAYGWSWNAVLLGVLPSALLFGAAAIATRGLACPLGIHVAINLGQWMTGETAGQGFLVIAVAPGRESAVAAGAPWIGCGITLLWAGAMMTWHRRRGPADR